MNPQQIFLIIELLVHAFALGAQQYSTDVIRADRAYGVAKGRNGNFLRYSETMLNNLHFGTVAVIVLFAIFALAFFDSPQNRPIGPLQVARGILFIVLDGCIVGRSFYTAIRYHQDVYG